MPNFFQVRIGMDLTKIVLPTFILERRSLLEMYADFFAHPDIFTDIAVQSSAEERMVQVLKWYLSSFSASRKSTVAKKPYNPIIGEIFRCYYPIPALSAPSKSTRSPVPWCKATDLVFIAEQVRKCSIEEKFIRVNLCPGVPPPARVSLLHGVSGQEHLLHGEHLHQVSLPRAVRGGE